MIVECNEDSIRISTRSLNCSKNRGDTLTIEKIIKVLLYFDVFSYPLTRNEIVKYTGICCGNMVRMTLNKLAGKGIINYYRGFYFIGEEIEKVHRRIDGNKRTGTRISSAIRFSKIISYFPFVQGVFLSGSISKGYMAPDDDIDYFIVTQPGRLWLTHTLLALFKKVILFNSYRNFCINYFVDSDHLTVSEKNRYTATEIVFLMPVFNYDLYFQMLQKNKWVMTYYPHFKQGREICTESHPRAKQLMEKILGGSFGNMLENYCYNTSRKYIKRKFRSMGKEAFSSSFSIRKHELKYFPNNQQSGILQKFNQRISEFRQKAGISFSDDNLYNQVEKVHSPHDHEIS